MPLLYPKFANVLFRVPHHQMHGLANIISELIILTIGILGGTSSISTVHKAGTSGTFPMVKPILSFLIKPHFLIPIVLA